MTKYDIGSWLHSQSAVATFRHLVFIVVEITIKTFRAIYIAKWRVFHASCVKVWMGAFPEGTRKYDPIWH